MCPEIVADTDDFPRPAYLADVLILYDVFKLNALVSNFEGSCSNPDFLIQGNGRLIGNMHIGNDQPQVQKGLPIE